MLKCIAKCSKGYDRCCYGCGLKDLCDEVCALDPKKCEYIKDTAEVRAEKRKRNADKRFWRLYIFLFVLILSVLIIGLSIIGNQNFIIMQNTDILNQQNTILLELDKQSIDPAAENRSQVNLEAQERALIERVVMSEAGDERLPIEARMAVAQTIYDRMVDFGDPLPEAIRTYSTKDNGEPTDSVKLAVSEVFDKGLRIYEGGTYQFHDDSVTPYWTEGKIARGRLGNLFFYGGWRDGEN